jgi:hypothetical protein
LRSRRDMILPALSLSCGHSPAHDRKCPPVANRLISTPISVMITCAAVILTPGIVIRRSTAARKGWIAASICAWNCMTVFSSCQLGSKEYTAEMVFTGSYVSDAASSGEFLNTDGIGSVNINNPSGLAGTVTNIRRRWWANSCMGGLRPRSAVGVPSRAGRETTSRNIRPAFFLQQISARQRSLPSGARPLN